jgi:ubiquinone biosynthesis monooxygenase Coq7
MAKIAHLPAMPWLLEIAYLIFLKIRPKLQKMVSIQSSKRGAPLPNWLRRELRSDHAGESGAVAIYQGILFVSRTRTVRDFALKHLKTEKRHLGLIEEVLPAKDKSLLTPLWRVAGFLTGAAPALFGFKAVCLTIDAVETFVVGHYTNQIERLSCSGDYPELLDLLKVCRDDEARHRDDARSRHNKSQGAISRAWCGAVRHGSFFAVFIAKRF